ncbi:sugar ABC transporter ATP-binding protein [Labrenzia sp. DG1229]|uniref:sugar ABC transporter ATP-binding protein n=1 Tax=Labrenzia sp. DG1229 TaxID=681847 RepID=UPI0004915912|nr:sugar ABC transporter ATP-binding protein [Labrenzia sp. DG1229]
MSFQSNRPVIEVDRIRKAFGPTIANEDVSFSVMAGESHAVLGENGAGKSTLMKLLSGLIRPDSGSIRLVGRQVRLKTPRDAHAAGIQTAFQELTLIPDLSVLDNMMMPRAAVNPLAMLRRRLAARAVSDHFAELGLEVPLHRLAGDLDLATRQKLEIARVLYRKPRILLLDEPTSALTGDDIDWLGRIIVDCKAQGVTVLFISHRLPEVRAFCDTLTILRNGRHVRSAPVEAVTDDEITELIVGRSMKSAFPPRMARSQTPAAPVLEARAISAGGKLRDVSLSLPPGQILGIAGLQGMGQKDLFAALFGDIPLDSGEIRVDDAPVHLRSPADALHPSIAIGMVPEERKTEGLFLTLSGKENASLPVIERFRKGLLLDADAEARATGAAFDAVEVAARAQYLPVSAFSGGNQQKIAIAKWLVAQSRILLLFDPTRGIDVGTKQQLYEWMHAFAAAGGAILFHSTEIPELVHLSDRVGVLYEGKVTTWLENREISETEIMRAALGGDGPREAAA